MLVAAGQHDVLVYDFLYLTVRLQRDRADHVDQASEITDRHLLYPGCELVVEIRPCERDLQDLGSDVGFVERLEIKHDHLAEIGVGHHPSGAVAAFLRQSVEAAVLQQRAVLLVPCDLLLHHLLLLRAQRTQVHLVPQHSERRDIEPGLDVRLAQRLVVRRCRDMGSHRADRVGVRRSALYLRPAEGIGIVARPDLRHEAEHSQVEPVAARSAALEQDVRERLHQACEYVVQTHDVPVEELAHAGSAGSVHVAEDPVHVPLHVIGLRQCEHIRHCRDYVVPYILPGQVQDELVPSDRRFPSGNHHRPVRMLVEQQAPAAHHLRFDPDAEHQPHGVYALGKPCYASRKLLRVHVPVAQAGAVVVPATEPAVVQNEQLHADFLRRFRQLQDPAFREVEVRGLPVVAQHRALPEFPRTAHYVVVDESVHVARRPVVSERRVSHYRFRSCEGLARLQRPQETLRVDARLEPRQPERRLLHHLPVVARIYQIESVAFPVRRRAVRPLQEHRGIVERARDPAVGTDDDGPFLQMPARYAPLAGPRPVERHHIPVRIRQVQLQTRKVPYADALLCAVHQDARPHQRVALPVHRVVQHQPDGQFPVLQLYLQRDGILRRHCVRLRQQSRDPRFSFNDPVVAVHEIQRRHPVGILQLDGRRAEIPLARGARLKTGGIHENQGLPLRIGHTGTYADDPFRGQRLEVRILPELPAVIQVLQVPGLRDPYDVRRPAAVQPDDSLVFRGLFHLRLRFHIVFIVPQIQCRGK